MRRSMSYADALRLLGEKESRVFAYLDAVGSSTLLFTGRFDLLEARREVIELGSRVLKNLGERLRGINKLTHRQRVYAAHSVVVITAFFEALDQVIEPFGIDRALGLGADGQAARSIGTKENVTWSSLALALARSPIAEPYGLGTDNLAEFYSSLAEDLLGHIAGLVSWDRLDETQRDRLGALVIDEVPHQALETYEEQLRHLAAVSTEFRVWLNLRAQQQTRDAVLTGLNGLEELLAGRDIVAPDGRRTLTRAYRAALDKPIAPSGHTDTDLTIPCLADGYVDHRYRFARCTGVIGGEEWWRDRPTYDGLVRFLAAHLISAEAITSPLLILGQPGSGKSVLTRVLAARLPEEQFLPIRVELRLVDADADLQDQIEAAIRLSTGESVQWPRFVESAPDAVPVVLLDGFDELLQATGVTRTDFLHNVARFQERESDQGRPVAVVVTSRTAVADRASLPLLTPVLRLEPFDEDQITAWLKVWNETNADAFERRRLQRLSFDCVLRFPELAEQPLLLLMLALYDVSTGNGLGELRSLDPVDVYERLFDEFCRRELTKGGDTSDLDHRVERELERLSIVAFAMFNRRSQWVGEEQLTSDFLALKLDSLPNQRGLRAPLTPGQQAVGKFFFIHDAMATDGGRISRTYEFLHATFSEFLIARLVADELKRITEDGARRTVDDAMLHAVLSFECLAVRDPIVEFLKGLLSREGPDRRRATAEILVSLHEAALLPRTESALAAYAPRALDVVERHVKWSANLVLLATLAAGELRVSRLFANHEGDVVREWHRHATLWRATLHTAGWDGLVEHIDVERTRLEDRRDLILRPAFGASVTPEPDLVWTFGLSPEGWKFPLVAHFARTSAARKAHFITGVTDDLLSHELWPLNALRGDSSSYFGRSTETNLLLSALVVPGPDHKPPVYERLIDLLLTKDTSNSYVMAGRPYVVPALAALLIAAELGWISGEQIGSLATVPYLSEAKATDPRIRRFFERFQELFPDDFRPGLT